MVFCLWNSFDLSLQTVILSQPNDAVSVDKGIQRKFCLSAKINMLLIKWFWNEVPTEWSWRELHCHTFCTQTLWNSLLSLPKKIKIKKESAAKTGTFRRKIFTEYEQYEKNIYIRIKTNYLGSLFPTFPTWLHHFLLRYLSLRELRESLKRPRRDLREQDKVSDWLTAYWLPTNLLLTDDWLLEDFEPERWREKHRHTDGQTDIDCHSMGSS